MKESGMKWSAAAVLRTVGCILMLVVAYLLQTSMGVRISIFGTHIDLMPAIVAAAGVMLGSGSGLACGLAAGILYDAAGTGVEGLYPLYYMICGIACGYLGVRFRGREKLCTALATVGTVELLSILRYLFYLQFEGSDALIFLRSIIVQGILAAICSVPMLWLVRKMCAKKKKSAAQPEI